MLISTILIALVTHSIIASPFNFPDESTSGNKQKSEMVMPGIYFHEPVRSSKSLDNEESESRNKRKEDMLIPGIYFYTPKSGKTLDRQNNPPAAISFGPSEHVRLPSMDSIRLSSPGNPPKEVIVFGEEPGDEAVSVTSGTTDKSDTEVNNAVLFFDEPTSVDNTERDNVNLPVRNPVPATFDIPVVNNFSKFDNDTEKTLELGIPVIITIDNLPIEGFLHFSNSTVYNETISSTSDLLDSNENDTNRIITSSESPVLFFNHIEDEAMNDDGITHFLFPTPRTTDITGGNDSSVILNNTTTKTCKSGQMLYNDSCYQLLTLGPCGNGSWLISKDGYSAECEERKCAADEVFLNNLCVSNNSNEVCMVGQKLYVNQSGIGYCQCDNGEIFYQDKCHHLLGQGPCGKNNWLILTDIMNVVCAPRQCAYGKILYNNKCVDPEDSTICASGQMLYIDITGDAYCDCDPDFIYIPHNGNCIPEYERGYCVWGEYLIWNEEEEIECVKNPCGVDGHVYHNATERCYDKKYIGHCDQDLIEIKGEEAECTELNLKNIFEVPTLRRCPRGSARDVLHECRKRYSMPSRSSVLTSKHLYGGCRSGWTKGPNGRCRKIVNMFG